MIMLILLLGLGAGFSLDWSLQSLLDGSMYVLTRRVLSTGRASLDRR